MKKRTPALPFLSAALKMLVITMLWSVVMISCGGVKDSDLQSAIDQKIQTTPEMTGVSASVKDGVVTLTGECKDDACKAYTENTVKGMKGVKSVVNNTTVAPPPAAAQAPVEIAGDDALAKSVADATKDYKNVKANVKDGVITLTGEIKRADLQKLMMSLNTLKPKKIDNQLVIK